VNTRGGIAEAKTRNRAEPSELKYRRKKSWSRPPEQRSFGALKAKKKMPNAKKKRPRKKAEAEKKKTSRKRGIQSPSTSNGKKKAEGQPPTNPRLGNEMAQGQGGGLKRGRAKKI